MMRQRSYVILVGMVLSVAGVVRGGSLTETFSGTALNSTYWQFETSNATAGVNNGLIIDIPAGATGWSAGIRSKFTLTGDFDVQVDYDLGNWQNLSNYGVAVGLSTQASGMYVDRVSSNYYYLGSHPVDRYQASASGNLYESNTTDTQGKLRFMRSTGTGDNWGLFQAYYWNSGTGSWQEIMSRNHQSGDQTFFLGAWKVDGTPSQALEITFSNLRVTNQNVPEPATLSLLAFSGLALWRRRYSINYMIRLKR